MVHKALAFIRCDFQMQASYRLSFLAQVAGVLVQVAIFYFISQTVGIAINPHLQQYGGDYFHFALIGIVFYPLISLSSNSLSEAVSTNQHRGTLEVLALSSTPLLTLLMMSTLWRYLWTLTVSIAYVIAAVLLFDAQFVRVGIAPALVVVGFGVLAHVGLGLINASFTLITKKPSPLAQILPTLMGLLAGVYYPVDILPIWLRSLGQFLPATYAFRALRLTTLQGASLVDVESDLMMLAVFTVLLVPIGLLSFQYALHRAKMDASLTQF